MFTPQQSNLTRADLYQHVWSEPMVHVAKRLGLSDRGLAKLCARYTIPVPPRGCWAKKQHGHRVHQTPLPPANGSGHDNIIVSVKTVEVESGSSERDVEAPELLRERDAMWRIDVPLDLEISHSHPLVRAAGVAIRRTARERRKNQPVHWNKRYQVHLLKPGPGHLDIAVSKQLVPRALRIMEALVTALERRGYAVSVNERNEIEVKVLDETMEIALIERLKQTMVKRSWGNSVDLEPSGRLKLRVGGSYSNSGPEDRPPRLIEGSLNQFVAGLVRRAFDAKHARAIHQDRERRWRIHDDERRQREQERDSERLRTRRLRTFAARWSRHQRLASFVVAVQEHARSLDADGQQNALRWVEWATSHLVKAEPVSAMLSDPWPIAPMRGPASMPWNWQ